MRRNLLILAVVLAVVLGACTLRRSDDYAVTTGLDGVHLQIVDTRTALIVNVLWHAVCNTNGPCAAKYLHDHVPMDGWGAAEWHTATTPLYYGTALGLHLNHLWFHHDYCLGLHKGWAGDLNWEHYRPCYHVGSGGGGGGSW